VVAGADGHAFAVENRPQIVGMHFVGAVVSLQVAWTLGDVFMGIVIIPNLVALVLLSGDVREILDSYFEREAWKENAEVHRRWVERRKAEKGRRD